MIKSDMKLKIEQKLRENEIGFENETMRLSI